MSDHDPSPVPPRQAIRLVLTTVGLWLLSNLAQIISLIVLLSLFHANYNGHRALASTIFAFGPFVLLLPLLLAGLTLWRVSHPWVPRKTRISAVILLVIASVPTYLMFLLGGLVGSNR